MSIKISDFTLPKEKLEKEYQVLNVSRWQKDGEVLGQSYERILPKLRFEKIMVKVDSEFPVISKEDLEKKGIATITFNGLDLRPWGRANGNFVNYGLSAFADSATLMAEK